MALVEPLLADVFVLSEIAPPQDQDQRRVQWIGDGAPGLAVFVRDGFELVAHAANAGAPHLTGGFTIRGTVNFDLLAAWPVQYKGGPTYHQILMRMLEHYRVMFGSGHVILAGDLNSSSRVQAQRHMHPVFVSGAAALGLVSAYHEQTGETHGAETVPTYLRGAGERRRFHLDYCFVPKSVAPVTNISVLRGGEWPKLSDHFPVVVDIPNHAFNERSP